MKYDGRAVLYGSPFMKIYRKIKSFVIHFAKTIYKIRHLWYNILCMSMFCSRKEMQYG